MKILHCFILLGFANFDLYAQIEIQKSFYDAPNPYTTGQSELKYLGDAIFQYRKYDSNKNVTEEGSLHITPETISQFNYEAFPSISELFSNATVQDIAENYSKKHGEWILYDDKQRIAEKTYYYKGELQGTSSTSTYIGNDTITDTYAYQKGILHGPFETFYLNNQPKLTGRYNQGERHGIWVKYDPFGRLLNKTVHSTAPKILVDNSMPPFPDITNNTSPVLSSNGRYAYMNNSLWDLKKGRNIKSDLFIDFYKPAMGESDYKLSDDGKFITHTYAGTYNLVSNTTFIDQKNNHQYIQYEHNAQLLSFNANQQEYITKKEIYHQHVFRRYKTGSNELIDSIAFNSENETVVRYSTEHKNLLYVQWNNAQRSHFHC